MQGRAFLALARELSLGATEAHWRGAAVHAYYALMLECRDALGRWGRAVPPQANVHSFVRLQFVYATDLDLKQISVFLDRLVRLRNRASYDLSSPSFATRRPALTAVQDAVDALALLDGIEADPVRLAATVASLPPPPP